MNKKEQRILEKINRKYAPLPQQREARRRRAAIALFAVLAAVSLLAAF